MEPVDASSKPEPRAALPGAGQPDRRELSGYDAVEAAGDPGGRSSK